MSTARPDSHEVPAFPTGSRVAIVAARWNGDIVGELLAGCQRRLAELGMEEMKGADETRVELFRVPGAYELPTAALWAAKAGRFQAVIAIGCVIRGDTPHFDYVAGECARGLMDVALATGVATIFGVLTVNTHQQALDRCGGAHGHAGIAAADAAAEMIASRRQIGG